MSSTPRTHKSSSKQLDAIEQLKRDHREVEVLFDDFKKLVEADAEPGEKGLVAAQICTDLTLHAQIEEELFYPAAREVLGESDLLDEATVEHASAKDLMAQIQAMEFDAELFDATVTVLGEYVKHHVQEEEKEMFPKLKKSGLDAESLGMKMSARREALKGQLADSGLFETR